MVCVCFQTDESCKNLFPAVSLSSYIIGMQPFLLSPSYFRISYPLIQIATQSGKSVYLTVTKDTNDTVVLLFKLISNRAASGLYRAITETHAFYR